MMILSPATFGASASMRQAIDRMQAEMTTKQTELVTGKSADPGLKLGRGVETLLALRHQTSVLGAFGEAHKLSATRLDATQAALTSVRADAAAVRDAALGPMDAAAARAMVDQANAALASATGLLNAQSGSDYVFAGTDSGRPPFLAYDSGAKAAIANAFSTAFGTTQDSASVASITPTAMNVYLDGAFAGLFKDPQWGALWSRGSDQKVTVAIAPGETAVIDATANTPAMRDLAMAYAMLSDSGLQSLSHETASVVLAKAGGLLNSAIDGLVATQGQVGSIQSRVNAASQRNDALLAALTSAAGDIENVDQYAIGTRVNDLQTQLETAYSLTARLQQLSLAKYL